MRAREATPRCLSAHGLCIGGVASAQRARPACTSAQTATLLVDATLLADEWAVFSRHPGVTCNKSGQNPIVGWRYQLKGQNYDLCEAEYDKLPDSKKRDYKKIAPPVDNLKMVTPYPKARATMNETTLSTLVPLGTPIVMHLYTG